MTNQNAPITIAGAGEMGRHTLKILADHLDDQRFQVYDINESSLERAREIAPERIETEVMEISPGSTPDLSGSAIVVNFAGPFYRGSDALGKAALAAGCPYIDICDDVEGAYAILDLDESAKRAGVPLITGAGNSPGISNVIGRELLERYPHADGIRVVWVVKDSDPGGVAPLRHMLHMAVEPCPIWDDGKMIDTPGYVPETALTHRFPVLGEVEAFDTAHPEPVTMSRAIPELRHVSVQGAMLPRWANAAFSTLGRIGFGYHDLTVELNGAEVRPDEVLWKVLWARHEIRATGDPKPGMTCVQVQALRGNEIVAAKTVYDNHSMVRTTALGASAAVLTVLDDRPPAGAWGTEILDPPIVLEYLAALAEEQSALPEGIIEEEFEPAQPVSK